MSQFESVYPSEQDISYRWHLPAYLSKLVIVSQNHFYNFKGGLFHWYIYRRDCPWPSILVSTDKAAERR